MEPKVFSSGKTRQGRGFSLLELKNAKIDIRMAKNLGLRVDRRRRTSYEENVRFLGEKVEKEKKRSVKGKKKGKKPRAGVKKRKEGGEKPSKTTKK
ncbi:MAG: ribosomal protein L13e [Thermoplasmata archaeon]